MSDDNDKKMDGVASHLSVDQSLVNPNIRLSEVRKRAIAEQERVRQELEEKKKQEQEDAALQSREDFQLMESEIDDSFSEHAEDDFAFFSNLTNNETFELHDRVVIPSTEVALDLLPNPVVLLDERGYVQWANSAWCEGNISNAVPPGKSGIGLHYGRDLIPEVRSLFEQSFETKTRAHKDLPTHTDRHHRWWRISFSPYEHGAVVQHFDVTELYVGHQLVNEVTVGIVRTNRDGIVEWANLTFERMRYKRRHQDVGQSLWNLLGRVQDWRPPRGAESSGPTEVWLPGNEGGIWVEVQTRPLFSADKHTGHLATMFDITDRVLLRLDAKQAWIDELTGLPNRRELTRELDKTLERREGTNGRTLAFMVIDLDGFKQINDTHGHQAGDEVLRTVAQRISNMVRSHDVPSRIGGDEFAVLLPYATDVEAMAVAGRMRTAIGRPIKFGDIELSVGASIGVTVRDHATSLADLVADADEAMYTAKRNGTGPVFKGTDEVS